MKTVVAYACGGLAAITVMWLGGGVFACLVGLAAGVVAMAIVERRES